MIAFELALIGAILCTVFGCIWLVLEKINSHLYDLVRGLRHIEAQLSLFPKDRSK